MNGGNDAPRRKVLLAGAIGNFVEWYDFALYGFFATTIASVFFPKTNPTAALLATFGIYAVTFVVRPLGGIVFGHLGDRMGRRFTLLMSVLLMCAGTFIIGILPGYAQIGVAAPVLLLLCRLMQGFSVGGENTGANIFIIEHAPSGMRGRFAAVGPAIVNVTQVFGVLVVVAITSATTPEQLTSWAWRVPFLAAAPLALIGVYLRLRVEESPVFTALRAEGHIESAPVKQAIKTAKTRILILVGWAMANAVALYLLGTFILAYLTVTVGFSKTKSLIVVLVESIVGVGACLLAGYCIDRLGRKQIAIISAVGLGVCAVPTFMLLPHSNVLAASVIVGVLALFTSGMTTTTTLAVVELFPDRIRASASALGYNISFALFGGSTPFLATWLVGQGFPLAPGFYLAGLCVIATFVGAVGIGNRRQVTVGHEGMSAPEEPASHQLMEGSNNLSAESR
ncbi:MFS transporter [Nocardia sp. NPDC059246]|uniref:MFS transporter n=1 Tax=unclassified Nocardia TaxID=2637762 RepID=UPI0036AC0F72